MTYTESLRQRSLLAAIFNESTDALFLVYPDSGITVDCNPQAMHLFEAQAREELIDQPSPHLQIPQPSGEALEQRLAEIQRLGYWSREACLSTLRGHTFWGNLTVKSIQLAGGSIVLVRITDISPRKEAEQLLADYNHKLEQEVAERTTAFQESEARYRLLAENMNDLVCQHDTDGRFRYISPSCEHLLGYRPEQLIDRSPYDFIHPEDQQRIRQGSHSQVLQGSAESRVTYRMRRKDGSYLWLETISRPILDATGKVVSLQSTSRDVQKRVEAEEQLRFDTLHDGLTRLANRNLLSERLELALRRQGRSSAEHFAILFLDLDRFKVINDSLGHRIGDLLLIAVADKLREFTREVDLVARISGDEFAILLENLSGVDEAAHVANRISAAFRTPFTLEDRQVNASTSIGIVLSAEHYRNGEDMLRDADIAMYRAKSSSSDYEIFDPVMHAETLRKILLENDLRQALQEDTLVLHYQPIIDLSTRQISYLEVLVRWQHPRLGLIYPGEFVPLAENMGLIIDLGLWILRRACEQMVELQSRSPASEPLKISVNLSRRQLHSAELVAQITTILGDTGFPAQRLILELTEGMLVDNPESILRRLQELRQWGIQFSIDDFGTGYSSLSYLQRFPVNSLKIDQSFVSALSELKKTHEIPGMILALGQQLGLDVVAEGIETQAQLRSLQAMGCPQGQGFLFSKPVPEEELQNLLARYPMDHF